MKLQLRSDFRDYYDYMFDRDGDVLERYTRTDMHRRDAFDLMSSAGYRVPPHGTAANLRKTFITLIGQTVVAYDDPYAHCGEGKRLERLNKVEDDTYCSVYLRPRQTPVSFRHLWIGQMCIALCYTSDDRWRSNVGEVSVVSLGMSHDMKRPATLDPYPLLAIDILPNPEDGRMENGFAVDLNTAPGLESIRDLMRAGDVVKYIKEFWYGRKTT